MVILSLNEGKKGPVIIDGRLVKPFVDKFKESVATPSDPADLSFKQIVRYIFC